MDTFLMLEELLEQDQFELLLSKDGETELRLVYLMNDAVRDYPRRSFGKEADNMVRHLEQQAEERRQELASQGIRAEVLREEPFTTAQDNLEFHVDLMIWETRGRDCQVRIETINLERERKEHR